MKFDTQEALIVSYDVAPYMGAWIEIARIVSKKKIIKVAPYMGAWIEITCEGYTCTFTKKSLPTWERGLKFLCKDRETGCY